MKDKIKQLKSIGRAIAKYPDEKLLESIIEAGKQELKVLVSGNTVKALICP
jgi:hypothetical protein